MYGTNLMLWWCMIPLIVATMRPYRISTSDDKKKYSTESYNGIASTMENENGIITHDSSENCNRGNNKNNIPRIRLCCPFGRYLINGTCIAKEGEFIFLPNMNGYVTNSLQNETKKIEQFLLVVEDPCQKNGDILLYEDINSYFINSYNSTLFVNGSLYVPGYNVIEKSYCLAIVEENVFAAKVCVKNYRPSSSPTHSPYVGRKRCHNKNAIRKRNHRSTNKNFNRSKNKNNCTSHDSLQDFNRNDSINPYEMCDSITCIRLCCPYGSYLFYGECIEKQDNFIYLQNINGYINDSLQIKNKKVDELFLLVVHDPCPENGYYLFYTFKTKFLINGALYLRDYNTIIETNAYCIAVVEQNIFAAKVCVGIAGEIMNKIIIPSKNANQSNTNEILERIKRKDNFTSHDFSTNFNSDNNENNINSYETCDNISYIKLCYPFGNRLFQRKCIAKHDNLTLQDVYKFNYRFENVYAYTNWSQKSVNEQFLFIIDNPCRETGYQFKADKDILLYANGSLYLHDDNEIINSTSYCFGKAKNEFIVKFAVCNKAINLPNTLISIYYSLVPMLLSLIIFIVYSIVYELRNIYGFIVHKYSGLQVAGRAIELMDIIIGKNVMSNSGLCVASAYVKYYFFLGSWFWLNVMCFDMWLAFRQMRLSSQRNEEQERRKLIRYSVFAWGSPFMLAIIYSIINFIPVPEDYTRLVKIGVNGCRFYGIAYLLYFQAIVVISVISSICLSICTARKIVHYERNIANIYSFRNLDGRYNDEKQCLHKIAHA
ncbi:uncharacterized protein [Anoplolepis gracilipes]|uniref:uncharacterized protein isoform X2 n=1 Tax=Anoplolepis gracilipes TaxID=354296 RepID=UPI003BA1D408